MPTWKVSPVWTQDVLETHHGILPVGDNASISSNLDAWIGLTDLWQKHINAGKVFSKIVVSTYSLVYTTANAYYGGVLSPDGDIHFVPYNAAVGQKINLDGTVSTYSLVYTTSAAYNGGVLSPTGDIHFAPNNAKVGQKISLSGTVSTYSLLSTSDKYGGGIIDINGNINFPPLGTSSTTAIKIDINQNITTYSFTFGSIPIVFGQYDGGAIGRNGNLYFTQLSGNAGGAGGSCALQKVNVLGGTSRLLMAFRSNNGFSGIVTSKDGEIHLIPYSANCGQKMSVNETFSTYSLLYTTTAAYWGGVLSANGDIYYIPYSAAVGQQVNLNGTISTYALIYTTSTAYRGGILNPNGDIYFIPYNAAVGQRITTMSTKNFDIGTCLSPYFNKF